MGRDDPLAARASGATASGPVLDAGTGTGATDREDSRSDHAGARGLRDGRRLWTRRSRHLDGRPPAPVRFFGAHVGRLLHGRVGKRPARGDHDAHENGRDPAERVSGQSVRQDGRTLLSTRRPAGDVLEHRRPDLLRGTDGAHADMAMEPEWQHGTRQRVRIGRRARRQAARMGAVLSAWRHPFRIRTKGGAPIRRDARRKGIALSRLSVEDPGNDEGGRGSQGGRRREALARTTPLRRSSA